MADVEPFGFYVRREQAIDHAATRALVGGPDFGWVLRIKTRVWKPEVHYTVALPHSCDSWVIAEGSAEEAVEAELERFIAEAQGALARLRAGAWDEDFSAEAEAEGRLRR